MSSVLSPLGSPVDSLHDLPDVALQQSALWARITAQATHSADGQGSAAVFSNLRAFSATCATAAEVAAVIGFLPSRLKELSLHFGGELQGADVAQFFASIQFAFPWLTALRVTSDSTMTDAHRQNLVALIPSLPYLESVHLSLNMVRDDVMAGLGDLARLHTLIVGETTPLSPHVSLSEASMAARVLQFPALHTISVYTSLSQAAEIVRATGIFVKRLSIHSHVLQHELEMRETLVDIIDFCPNLRRFSLNISSVNRDETAAWIDLRAFYVCAELSELRIRHPRPLPLTDDHIDNLLQALFRVVSLSLNPRPQRNNLAYYHGRVPTLKCLESVARSGQSLEHFAIYLRPNVSDGEHLHAAEVQPALRSIDLGRTGGDTRGGEGPVALLLRRLFPSAVMVSREDNSEWVGQVVRRHRGF